MFKRKKKLAPTKARSTCAAIVVAAGNSSRMGGMNKITADLCGMPVLAHTIIALAKSEVVDEIVVVTRKEDFAEVYDICFGMNKVTTIVPGGETRIESTLCGLREVNTQLVAVHDGARPLVRVDDIDAVIAKAAQYGAAVLASPINDTIKCKKDDIVSHTLDRSQLVAVTTPQVFDRELLIRAMTKATISGSTATDDAAAVEKLGVPVHIVMGEVSNLKITRPQDLIIAKALLEASL